jgi:hypothetical protein
MRSVNLGSVNRALLGSAAGIFAVTAGQAADLPVKARPVEYVKVCTLYGAGFWYVPGTDTCIKIGTYARIDFAYGASGSGLALGTPAGLAGDSPLAFLNTNTIAGRNDRMDTDEFGEAAHFGISLDARTQTEYGTLRSFVDIGAAQQDAGGSGGTYPPTGGFLTFDRAFIQFAGFTAGRIRSFFDAVAPGPYGLTLNRTNGDTAGGGILGMGYTLPLAGGFSLSASAEDPGFTAGGRGRSTVDLNALGMGLGGPGNNQEGLLQGDGGSPVFSLGNMTFDNKSLQFPDLVAALRLDQSWGFAQVAGAVHDNSGGYYTNPAIIPCSGGVVNPATGCGTGPVNINGGGAGSSTNGYPADKLGWAAIAGFTLVNAFGLAGDTLAAQGVYSSGASGYATKAGGSWLLYGSNNNVGMGWVADGVFLNSVGAGGAAAANSGSGVENTAVWSTYGVYEHLWTPKWRTSLYGGFVGVDYDSTVINWMCNPAVGGQVVTPIPANALGTSVAGSYAGGTPLGFSGYNNAGGAGVIKSQVGVPAGTQSASVANYNSNIVSASSPVFAQVQGPLTHINCDPDFSWAQIGTRTLWNPVPDVDIGLEFMWVHLNTAFAGSSATIGMSSNRPSGFYNFVNQDAYTVMFRFQRSFLY